MNQAILLPTEYTVGTTKLSPTDHRVLTGWYTDTGIILKLEDNRKDVAVPLVDDDKLSAMRKMYPRMFPWLQAVYHYEPVSDRHIGTLLWYASLGQKYPHHYRMSAWLSPDTVFQWSTTFNERVFLTLESLFSRTPNDIKLKFPFINDIAHASQYTREYIGEVAVDIEGEYEDEEEDEDD